MIIYRDSGEAMLVSCKDLIEIYKVTILRDGKIYLQVTSSKDKGGKFLLGGIKLPKSIKDIPNGNFSIEVLNWFFKGLNLNGSFVKISKDHTKCEVFFLMNDGREYHKTFSLR